MIKTTTLAQIDSLRDAIDMAADWRGNRNPDEHEEFDAWIDEMREALRQVRKDRYAYRTILKTMEQESNETHI